MNARDKRRKSFMLQHQRSKQISEGGGLGFFKPNLEGVTFWKCAEGDHDIDIIPFYAGPDHPIVAEGEDAYVLEVYEHRNVGNIEGQSFICLAKTFKKPCPICEHRQQLQKEGQTDEDTLKSLRPSYYPRAIYNIVVYDTDVEEDKGVQVFHTSSFLMQKNLIKLAQSTRREIADGEPPYKFFADPEEGYSVKFTRSGSGMTTQFSAHTLVKRKYEISQEILDQAHQLDQLIHIPTYEEVSAAYWGESYEAPEPEKPRARQQARSAQPPRGRGRPKSQKRKVEVEDRFEEEDELPESLQSVKGKKETHVCPGGGTFGVDSYDLDECENCAIWEACYAENEKLSADGIEEDTDTPQAIEIEDVSEDEPEPPKRGRGRPRRSNGNGSARARRVSPQEESAPPTKRPRGRPRRTAR